jgi:hypothetical protein
VTERVIVSMAPAAELSPNYHGNWRPRARAVRTLRQLTKLECPKLGRPIQGRVLLEARIGWSKGRKVMDNSNAAAALKPLVDGLTDAGWWPDDNLVNVIVVEQFSWGKLDHATRALYPGGFVSFDVVRT